MGDNGQRPQQIDTSASRIIREEVGYRIADRGPDGVLVSSWNQKAENRHVRIGTDSLCMVMPAVTSPDRPSGLWLHANDNYGNDNGDVGYDILALGYLIG